MPQQAVTMEGGNTSHHVDSLLHLQMYLFTELICKILGLSAKEVATELLAAIKDSILDAIREAIFQIGSQLTVTVSYGQVFGKLHWLFTFDV